MKKQIAWILALLLVVITNQAFAAKGACLSDANGNPCSEGIAVNVTSKEYRSWPFDMVYPQLAGMPDSAVQGKINAILQKRAEEFRRSMNQAVESGKGLPTFKHFTAKMEYTVRLQIEDKISLTLMSYTFTGGAHGSSSLEGYTFDLVNGKLLQYSDLFKLDPASRKFLNDEIAKQIMQRNIPIFNPFRGIGDNPGYYLKEGKKVVIVFQQYEIAPYSSGILEFEIPNE